MHITAAAGELVKHLAAEPDALTGESPLPVLARAGAQALVSSIELDGTGAEASPLLSRKCPAGCVPLPAPARSRS